MKKFALFIVLIFIGMYLKAQEDSCSLMANWKTEKEIIAFIENSFSEMSETLVPNKSSWMISAHYYPVNEKFGYLIVKSSKKVSIHQDVPATIWSLLKNANSKGGFYNFYIKNNYKLKDTPENSEIL